MITIHVLVEDEIVMSHIYNGVSFFVLMYIDLRNHKFEIELGGKVILT